MTRGERRRAFDRWLARLTERPVPWPAAYLYATAAVVATALVRAAVTTALLPWLFFIPVILLCALALGRAPGAWATLLASGGGLWLVARAQPLAPAHWWSALLFALVNLGIVALAGELRTAFARAERAARERARAEEELRLLNGELSHRLKNVLAMVQAIASQTLRRSAGIAAAEEALSARLAALGQASDVLTAGAWRATELGDLAASVLAVHGGEGDRVRVSGPAFALNARCALALALALHELATNAVKYGALSSPAGHVELVWSTDAGTGDAPARFKLLWREMGGPAVSPPARRGFGSSLIERSLRAYFRGGTATLDFHHSGVTFTLDAPLGEAGA